MRSRLISIVAMGCALGALDAVAQAYPTKPVRIIVPFPPVGAADLLSRTIAQKLTEAWGHQVLVENRPGVGGNLEGRCQCHQLLCGAEVHRRAH